MEVRHKDWDHVCPGNRCRYAGCENSLVNPCQGKQGSDPLYRRMLQSENQLAKFHSRLREKG